MQKLLTGLLLAAVSQGALAQQLELISGSSNVPNTSGPTVTPPAATFRLSNNATVSSTTPSVTAQVTFSGQVYTSAAFPGVTAGGSAVGANATTITSTPIYPIFGNIGSPDVSHYTSAPYGTTAGTGIVVNTATAGANAGIRLFADVTYLQGQSITGRYKMANMTINFSRPVLDPVVHFAGIGGATYTDSAANGDPLNALGFYTEFDVPAGANYSLTRLSGSQYFTVSSTSITNSAPTPAFNNVPTDISRYALQSQGNYGSGGSVRINTNGTPVSSVTFEVWIQGDGGVSSSQTNIPNGWLAINTPRAGDAFNMSLSIGTYSVSGNVYNDANALTDGIVNSNGPSPSIPSGLFANLIGTDGNVYATTTVSTTATPSYSFPNVVASDYTLVLSTTQGVIGTTTGATASLPTTGGWSNTGENLGTAAGNDGTVDGRLAITVGASSTETSVTNANFGIQRPPVSDVKNYTLSPTPSSNQNFTLNGVGTNNGTGTTPPQLTGSDPEDLATANSSLSGRTVRITSLPTNGHQLQYSTNGTTFTTVTLNQTITNFNPANLRFRTSGIGTTSTFNYAHIDNAGIVSTPTAYTLTWSTPLALELVRFDAAANGCEAKLAWEVEDGAKAVGYDVQFSRTGNARDFATVASFEAGKTIYETAYTQPQGEGFYRIRTVEASGEVSFSAVRSVRTSCGLSAASVSLSPNPTQGVVKVAGLQTGSVLRLMDMHGKVVIAMTATGTTSNLDLSTLAAGTYHLVVTAEGSANQQSFKVVKQ